QVWDADLPPDRGDVDDAPVLALPHACEDGHGRPEGAPEHDVHRLLEVLDALSIERSDGDDAGVVDEDVDVTEPLCGRGDEGFDRRTVANVTRLCQHLGAHPFEVDAGLLELRFVTRTN